jgi:hypothetical protein
MQIKTCSILIFSVIIILGPSSFENAFANHETSLKPISPSILLPSCGPDHPDCRNAPISKSDSLVFEMHSSGVYSPIGRFEISLDNQLNQFKNDGSCESATCSPAITVTKIQENIHQISINAQTLSDGDHAIKIDSINWIDGVVGGGKRTLTATYQFSIGNAKPQDGPFTLPCSMQEKGDGVFTSSCNGIYENGMAKAKVGINYGSGLFPIKNYVAVGYFIDKNGNQGPNIKVTLDQINPKESKELVFVNPISGFVSEFKMQMLGGKIVTSEPKPVITCPDGFDLSSDGKCVIAPGRPKIESKTELKTSKSSSTVQLNGKTFDITYEATGLTIYTIQADTSSATITVSLANVDASGTLQIVFDRSFFDSRTNNSDDQFLVLADGAEVQFTEIKTNASRTLTITVPAGTNNVDIVSQGNTNFGNSVSKNSKPSETKTTVIPPTPTKTKPLACGNGTVLDSKTNTCIVASATISTQTTPAKATTETNTVSKATPAKSTTETNTVSKATPAKSTTETNTVSKATPAKSTDFFKKTDEKTKRIEVAKEKAKEQAKQKAKSKSK